MNAISANDTGMTQDQEQDERIADAVSHLDQMETLIFLGGVKAFAANRITFEDFERDVGGLIGRYRAGEELTVADLPTEWMQPN